MDSTFLLPLCISEGHYAQMMEWADNNLMRLTKANAVSWPEGEYLPISVQSAAQLAEWDPVDNVLKMSSSFVFLVKSSHRCICA